MNCSFEFLSVHKEKREAIRAGFKRQCHDSKLARKGHLKPFKPRMIDSKLPRTRINVAFAIVACLKLGTQLKEQV